MWFRKKCKARYQSPRSIRASFPQHECELPRGHKGPHMDKMAVWTDSTTKY